MTITLDITRPSSLAPSDVSIKVCDMTADAVEMQFATDLVDHIRDFANNYFRPKKEELQ